MVSRKQQREQELDKKVAALCLEGYGRTDIARKLRRKNSDVEHAIERLCQRPGGLRIYDRKSDFYFTMQEYGRWHEARHEALSERFDAYFEEGLNSAQIARIERVSPGMVIAAKHRWMHKERARKEKVDLVISEAFNVFDEIGDEGLDIAVASIPELGPLARSIRSLVRSAG